MKVLIVSPLPPPVGGIATWTVNVLQYLKETSDVEILHFNSAIKFRKITNKNKTVRIIGGTADAVLLIVRFFFKATWCRPDLVHLTSSAGYGLYRDRVFIRIAKLFKIKTIIHWRFGRIPELSLLKNKEWQTLKKNCELAAASIVIDKPSLNALQKAGIENVYYIPNPFPVEKLSRYVDKTVERSTNTVIFIGHLIKEKGIFELVASIVNMVEPVVLKMIGPYEDVVVNELKKIADKKDNGNWIQFLGKKEAKDVYIELQKATILCLPSYTEGFPNVVLEAMFFSCPVIATDVGAIPDMLNVDSEQKSGICVPVKDANQLSQAIKNLLLNDKLRLEISKNAHSRLLNEYTIEEIVCQYKSVWSQINEQK